MIISLIIIVKFQGNKPVSKTSPAKFYDQNFTTNPSIFLLPGEKIVFKTNPHWLFIVIPVVIVFAVWLFYVFYACPLSGQVNFNSLEDFCLAISSFAALFPAIILYPDWRFNRLYLTNLRLIKQRGIIGKRYTAIGLDKIQDITCSYGISGRIFGFGDLIIESAGTEGKLVFEGMPSPKKFKWTIEREASRFGPKSAL